MKRYAKQIAFTVIYYAILLAVTILAGWRISAGVADNRIAYMNRMTEVIRSTGKVDHERVEGKFSPAEIPSSVRVYSLEDFQEHPLHEDGSGSDSHVWSLHDEEGNLTGFVIYHYDRKPEGRMMLLIVIGIFLAALPLILYALWVERKVLRPFREFSEYPVRLSKGQTTDSLPETKNRLFGKYVWGMNMLNDRLDQDRKSIERLLYDRKNFVSSLAHGIKTPVANIKLYSEAIETGLYRNGVPDPKDSEIARKIGRNADEIARLVSGILDDPGAFTQSFEPSISSFYLHDVRGRIEEDFQNRLTLRSIPFTVEMASDPLIESDFEAIIRILTQLMENAIKYGDGTGICLRLYRQDEQFYFSVSNRGEGLSESEIPLVFNCYYRGSNSVGKEGSGIGLYEARSIARVLGGEIMMRCENGSTEVVLYL